MSSIAMAWPTHEAHRSIQQWLNDRARERWAPCPLTQNAFVRIFSNPAFSPKALTPVEALALRQANRSHRTHRFSEEEIGVVDALRPLGARLTGHRQVTDSYLVGL